MQLFNRKPGKIYHLSLIFTLCMVFSDLSWAQTYNRQLADGVTLSQVVTQSSNQPQVINVLKVDRQRPGVNLQAVIAQDKVMNTDATKGRESISSIAKRLNATAVINADFFPFTGDMLNMHITGGELISEPMADRMIFGITSDGRCLIDTLGFNAKLTLQDGRFITIRGINRPRGKNEVVAYTSKYSSAGTEGKGVEALVKINSPVKINTKISGTVTEIRNPAVAVPIPADSMVISGEGISAIPVGEWLKSGDTVTIEFNITPACTSGWETVTEAVGGNPILMKNGKLINESFDNTSFSIGPHPRTAAGVTADGKLVLATVDGRQSISRGMSLKQIAEVMKSQGCIDAVNLDGGGSTTMATLFGILNSPSEGAERPVANGVAVFGSPLPDPESYPAFAISALPEPVKSGTSVQLSLVDASTGEALSASLADQVIWCTTGGIGFVDQSGKLYGVKARKGKVIAKLGAVTSIMPVEVIPGDAAKFSAKIDQDESGAPNRSTVSVSVTDLNGNSISGQLIHLNVTGGTPDLSDMTTDSKGKVSTGITWDAAPGEKAFVVVTCGGFKPETLNRPKQP
ncbi:MAG: phosphodiester glycosidase family protein [Armatimonadota bacterium]